MSETQLPISAGIEPEMWFDIRRSFVRLRIRNKPGGRLPVSSLWDKSRACRLPQPAKADGTLPSSLFCQAKKISSFDKCPISAGIVPAIWLVSSCN